MNSLNKVQLIGNLTADPEVKETPNGRKVAKLSIATSSSWKDKDGNKQESSEFHSLEAWGNTAEFIEKYLSKGNKAYIE